MINVDVDNHSSIYNWFLSNSLIVICLSFVVFLNPTGGQLELLKIEGICNFLDLGKVYKFDQVQLLRHRQ